MKKYEYKELTKFTPEDEDGMVIDFPAGCISKDQHTELLEIIGNQTGCCGVGTYQKTGACSLAVMNTGEPETWKKKEKNIKKLVDNYIEKEYN